MPNEADELLVVQMDNLLRVLLVCKIRKNNLSVIWRKTFVRHDRIVNLFCLEAW